MSTKLFAHNDDLRRLREDGFFVQIRHDHLVMRGVPYVNEQGKVAFGTLISTLELAGDKTRPPQQHVVLFNGDHPCDSKSVALPISNESRTYELAPGLSVQHSFSQKPDGGYTNYHHKMTTYAAMLTAPARVVDPDIRPRVFAPSEIEEPDSVFEYLDTATGRAGISMLAERLAAERVAIIGVGGTGSYILDLVAKTKVVEIRLFDDDEFLNHNAFRSPGAPSLEILREAMPKVEYFHGIYSRMRKGITTHTVKLGPDNVDLLDGITFAFVSMDEGEQKLAVIQKLEAIGASFIDVGMGLGLEDGALGGILRVTVSTPERRKVIHQKVSFTAPGYDDIYEANIQVAELNCLNAALAVARWKRLRGFYRDVSREHHASFTVDGNLLINSRRECSDI